MAYVIWHGASQLVTGGQLTSWYVCYQERRWVWMGSNFRYDEHIVNWLNDLEYSSCNTKFKHLQRLET